MDTLNLHHLEIFDAVSACGSVSKGAEKLLISQPAVSKQLQTMERSLGVKLFDRHARGIRLTAAGEVLKEYSTRIFAYAADACRAVQELSSLGQGHLSIGAAPTAGIYLLPPAMVEFRRQFPGIHLHLETASAPTLRAALLDGTLNFAITELPIQAPELLSNPLITDRLIPISAANHPLASRRSISPKSFADQPFVTRETPSGSTLVERSLADRGLAVHSVLTVSSTEAMKQAVIAGLGVAMISRLAVQMEIAAGYLTELPVKGLAIPYPIFHVRRRNRTDHPATTAFLSVLKKRRVG